MEKTSKNLTFFKGIVSKSNNLLTINNVSIELPKPTTEYNVEATEENGVVSYTVDASKGKYLSDTLKELPANCILNKTVTGCGGTTIAIRGLDNYIIAVPFVEMIKSKVSQEKDLLGVYGKCTTKQIKDFIKDQKSKGKAVKIMATYDSLVKVMSCINAENYRLLVDEFHILFTAYSYRDSAINGVLDNYNKFKSFCFMSATPIEEKYMIKELKGLNRCTILFNDIKQVKVKSVHCSKSVNGIVTDIIYNHIEGKAKGNAYFFVNSVDFIKSIINHIGLDNDNCRVIYSKNNKTELTVYNGSTTDSAKKINFITSTCFEGADIYDKDAVIYIVSDASKSHTLLDISNSFKQIIGRVRNADNSTIGFIHTGTRYNEDLTYEEFLSFVEEEKLVTMENIEYFNNAPNEKVRNRLKDSMIGFGYTSFNNDSNMFEFNEMLVNVDLWQYELSHSHYLTYRPIVEDGISYGYERALINKQLTGNGYSVERFENIDPDPITLKKDRVSFEDMMMLYKAKYDYAVEFCKDPLNIMDYERVTKELYGSDEYLNLKSKYKNLPFDAIDKIGWDRLNEMKFVLTNIRRELLKHQDISIEAKIAGYLAETGLFRKGGFITAKQAKQVIINAYNHFGVPKPEKIAKYYETKETVKWIYGKSVKGYIVVFPKFIIK